MLGVHAAGAPFRRGAIIFAEADPQLIFLRKSRSWLTHTASPQGNEKVRLGSAIRGRRSREGAGEEARKRPAFLSSGRG
jgi:hypothetical protein